VQRDILMLLVSRSEMECIINDIASTVWLLKVKFTYMFGHCQQIWIQII